MNEVTRFKVILKIKERIKEIQKELALSRLSTPAAHKEKTKLAMELRDLKQKLENLTDPNKKFKGISEQQIV